MAQFLQCLNLSKPQTRVWPPAHLQCLIIRSFEPRRPDDPLLRSTKDDLADLAAWNSGLQEEVNLVEFEDFLANEEEENKLVEVVDDPRDMYISIDYS